MRFLLLFSLLLAACTADKPAPAVACSPASADTGSEPLIFMHLVGAGNGVAYAATLDELWVIRGDTARRVVVLGEEGRRIQAYLDPD